MNNQSLLEACTVRGYQGSGPGGQHRNKTNTGVKLSFAPFNLEIRCCEDRSAQVNRTLALGRMRLRIAIEIREVPTPVPPIPFPGSAGRVSPENPLFPLFVADCLDRIAEATGDHRPAAKAWGISSSALLRILFQEKAIIEATQKIRQQAGLGPLKAP